MRPGEHLPARAVAIDGPAPSPAPADRGAGFRRASVFSNRSSFGRAGAEGPAARARVGQPPPRAEAEPPPPPPGPPGGRAEISREEAAELLDSLDLALAPVEEAEAAREDLECLRELRAGPYPSVLRLRDRLRAFVATSDPGALFEVSHGEVVLAQKAVDCAVSLGRARAARGVLTAAGVGAGVLLLLLL